MNRISKKLLLCALLVGGIFTSNVNADSLTNDEISAQITQENIDLSMFDNEEKRAERAAKKVAAEADAIDYSTGNLYEEETTTPASASMTKAKSARTKKRRKSAKNKKRRKSAHSKKTKKTHSKSTHKGKKGSKFEKRRIARKKSVRKAKATRKSKTTRTKGVAQKAGNKGRVKSWKARHKKTHVSRSKKAPKTSAQRAAMARKRAEKMLAKQPWTLKQHTSAKRLRARLTKLLPQPYTPEDTNLIERLDSSIEATVITVE